MVANIEANAQGLASSAGQFGNLSPLGQAAIAYARAGYKVLPIVPDCPLNSCPDRDCKKMKAPLGPLAPNGKDNATDDLNRIASWWQQYPDANIGVACQASGIIAIDLDTHEVDENGVAAFEKLKSERPWPATAIQRTPGGISGGMHLIFKHPDCGVKSKIQTIDAETGKLADCGVDIRSNAYIVVAPSTNHGRQYAWLEGYNLLETAPAEMPDWLLDHVAEKANFTPRLFAPVRLLTNAERETVLKALECIPADDFFIWLKVGMALKSAGFDHSVWENWSQKSVKFQSGICSKKWDSFRREGVSVGTIFFFAKQHGFSFPKDYFARNDSGNAARLAAHFGHQLRWYGPSKNWLIWDGKRWKPDTLEKPIGFAKETARLIFEEAHDSDALKFAALSASASKIDAMLKLAKPDLALDADMLDVGSFMLNCNNGTIDLETGALLPHRQEDFITKLAPVDYDPNARAPRFELFLSEIFAGSQSLIDFVQCALGSSLTGSVKDQKLFIAHGSGQNGKSTLFDVIRATLGDYAQETDPNLLVGHQKDGPSEGVFRLRGVRLATTTEGEEGASMNEARVKQLTGGDRLTARPLHGHFAEFDPSHKLWLITNPLPRIKSQGRAIWRRIKLVPFTVAISDANKDRDLPGKLRAELPGILAWLVRGCIKWQREGLPEPPEVQHATDRYKGEEDTLSEFIEDRCYLDAEAQTQTSILLGEYVSWCRANNEEHPTRNAFNARLREKGFVEKDTKTCKMWVGIGLKSHCEVPAINQLDDLWKTHL